jgi:hypothetical protein
MRNVSDRVVEKNQKTHFMFNYFVPKIVLIMRQCENYCIVRKATDDNMIQRMLFACWIIKFAGTHSEYVILNALPRQQWLRERVSYYVIRTLPVL